MVRLSENSQTKIDQSLESKSWNRSSSMMVLDVFVNGAEKRKHLVQWTSTENVAGRGLFWLGDSYVLPGGWDSYWILRKTKIRSKIERWLEREAILQKWFQEEEAGENKVVVVVVVVAVNEKKKSIWRINKIYW